MRETIRDFLSFLFTQGTSAGDIDKLIRAVVLEEHPESPLLLVKLDSLEEVAYMCGQANHVLCVPDGRETVAGALYTDITTYPVARLYHLRIPGDIFAGASAFKLLKTRGFNVEMPSQPQLSILTNEKGWQDRLKRHIEQGQSRLKDYEKIRKGRVRNTTTDSTFFLHSAGCLICGAPSDTIASTTMASPGEAAHLTAVRLCAQHTEESRSESSLMNYLAKRFNIPFSVNALKRKPVEVLADAIEIMRSKLGMDVYEQTGEVVKARTGKGTILIYRFEGEMNYGYMINGPGRKEALARIDSADHHIVEVGPDHLHPDLKKGLPPVSSFTTGDLCLDWPLIKHLVAHWEVAQHQSGH